jgi:hypothetical protein
MNIGFLDPRTHPIRKGRGSGDRRDHREAVAVARLALGGYSVFASALPYTGKPLGAQGFRLLCAA